MAFVNSKLVQCVGRPRQAGWDCPGTFNGLGLIEKDPFWASSVLLLKLDTDYLDSSPAGATVTNVGTSLTTVNAKFTGSASFTRSTTNSISVTASTNYDLNSGDFTIEGWVRVSDYASGAVGYFLRVSNGATDEYQVFLGGNAGIGPQNISASYPIDPTTSASLGATAIALNSWTHVAFTRSSNTYGVFVNGVLVASASNAYRRPASAKNVCVGNNSPGLGSTLTGLYDEVRITKGVARYTSSFTPPTGPFPTS